MSIQPVPPPSAANALATSAPSSTDALSTLLAMSPEAISRRGVPAPLFSAWVTEFRNGLKDGTLVLCLMPEQELQTLVAQKEATITEEGCDISPKAVIDKLVAVAKNQYLLALKAPKEAAVEIKKPLAELKTAQPVPPAEVPKKTRAKKTVEPEQQIAAGRQQAAAALELNRHTPPNTAERPLSEALPQDLSCLGYTPREQSQIASIYQGQPMKATTFTTFAMNLLRKQAQAKGASTSTNTKKGSHPTVHFKRSDGTSGGVTFAVHHGKKDAHGFAPGQRGTLDAIFRL